MSSDFELANARLSKRRLGGRSRAERERERCTITKSARRLCLHACASIIKMHYSRLGVDLHVGTHSLTGGNAYNAAGANATGSLYVRLCNGAASKREKEQWYVCVAAAADRPTSYFIYPASSTFFAVQPARSVSWVNCIRKQQASGSLSSSLIRKNFHSGYCFFTHKPSIDGGRDVAKVRRCHASSVLALTWTHFGVQVTLNVLAKFFSTLKFLKKCFFCNLGLCWFCGECLLGWTRTLEIWMNAADCEKQERRLTHLERLSDMNNDDPLPMSSNEDFLGALLR